MPAITNLHDFGELLRKVLSPSRPIQSIEHLFGRERELQAMEEGLCADGRHVFLWGDRGVGKSSLAAAAAAMYQSSDAEPIQIGCDSETTFAGTIDEITRRILRHVNARMSTKMEVGVNALITVKLSGQEEPVTIPAATSPQNAVDVMAQLAELHSTAPVIVVDEFDQIESETERKKFATFLKLLGDHGVAAKLIFTGIASSLQQLIGDHASSHRQLLQLEVKRLNWSAREEIVSVAAQAFELKVDKEVTYAIAKISNGFPFYVHLLTERLLWEAFRAEGEITVLDRSLFAPALTAAIEATAAQYKGPYERATVRNGPDWYLLVWATADSESVIRTTDAIYKSYLRIHQQIYGSDPPPEDRPLPQSKIVGMLRQLKKEGHGRILENTDGRKGLYSYRENILRGYVAMRALDNRIELQGDVPDEPRKPTALAHERRHLFSANKDFTPRIKFRGE